MASGSTRTCLQTSCAAPSRKKAGWARMPARIALQLNDGFGPATLTGLSITPTAGGWLSVSGTVLGDVDPVGTLNGTEGFTAVTGRIHEDRRTSLAPASPQAMTTPLGNHICQ